MDRSDWLDKLHKLTNLDQAKLPVLLDLILYNKAEAEDTNRAQSASSSSINKALYKDVLLLPLIISRDWMLNGIRWDDDVPVISEALFDFVLDSAPAEDHSV